MLKGQFTVYTTDVRRFEISLSNICNRVIRELFAVAEQEFGIPNESPIALPPLKLEKDLSGSMNRCSCYLRADVENTLSVNVIHSTNTNIKKKNKRIT